MGLALGQLGSETSRPVPAGRVQAGKLLTLGQVLDFCPQQESQGSTLAITAASLLGCALV